VSSATVESSAAQSGIAFWVISYPLPPCTTAMPALSFFQVASVYRVCLSFLGNPASNRRMISASSPSKPLVLHPWMPSIYGSRTTASTVSTRLSAVNPMVGPNFLAVLDRGEGYFFPCEYSLVRQSNSGFVLFLGR
jgi:hypothetical protein